MTIMICWMCDGQGERLVSSDSFLFKLGLQDLNVVLRSNIMRWFGHVNKIELMSFKSSEHINEKGDGPYHGFGYLSLFSDPTDLAT